MMNRIRTKGYLLPATIMLGLGISIASGAYLSVIAATGGALNTQYYNSIAEEAALSGMAFADSCLSQEAWISSDPLMPNTNCNGSTPALPGSQYITVKPNEWRSTFTVAPKDAEGMIIATGTVQILDKNNDPVAEYTATKKMPLDQYDRQEPSQGESITDIKADLSNCAIANGKLYCWGDNSYGQLGRSYRGNSTPTTGPYAGVSIATPAEVGKGTASTPGSDISGKTVTRVSVAYGTVCAVADGDPYCWGDNQFGQLGDGSKSDRSTPDDAAPRRSSSSPLYNKKVLDISTSSANNPAGIIWPYARADPHTCAQTDEGAMACWGDGDFRQLTGGGITAGINWICDPIFQLICVPYPALIYDYPSSTTPILVIGYRSGDNAGDSPLAGKKAERVGASSHDSCAVAEGQMFCMGVPAPIDIICSLPLGQFSGSSDTLMWAPFNICINSYTNGYDVGGAVDGRYIDPNSWELSSNESCMMANKEWVCFGTTPAFTPFWFDAWGPPRVTGIDLTSNPSGGSGKPDVTSSDNGDYGGPLNFATGGFVGSYCAIDRGTAGCSGNFGNGSLGIGFMASNYKTFWPLVKTSGLEGKTPTKIAAGEDHGCVVANGQLLCWGRNISGALGHGSTTTSGSSGFYNTATVTGDSTVGTQSGIAASGAISVGDKHSCGVANGDLFCWGNNNKGQLGTGNTNPSSSPLVVKYFDTAYNDVTKVSAGLEHTCAIAYGDLFCWGDNTYGQLGQGNKTNNSSYKSPTRVTFFNNKRVTDVSAGATGTCAIADGQAYCWGNNASRQLGISGSPTEALTPSAVNDAAGSTSAQRAANTLVGKAATSISLGTTHACAVANADLFCWGDNSDGRTGLGITTPTVSQPTKITLTTAIAGSGPNNMTPLVTSVSAGNNFTCAVIKAKVSCWGDNSFGQLGRGYAGPAVSPRPSNAIPAGSGSATAANYYASSISAGNSYACAVLNGGQSAKYGNLFCWGKNADGQLGQSLPANPASIDNVITGGATVDGGKRQVAISVAAGTNSSCAVANGKIMCWGNNTYGQLGLGTTGSAPAGSDYKVPNVTDLYVYPKPYVKGPIF